MNSYELVVFGICLAMIVGQWGLIVALINRLLRQAGQRPIAGMSDTAEVIRGKAAPLKAVSNGTAPSGRTRVNL